MALTRISVKKKEKRRAQLKGPGRYSEKLLDSQFIFLRREDFCYVGDLILVALGTDCKFSSEIF